MSSVSSCAACGAATSLVCASCLKARFCSPACACASWAGHRAACADFSVLASLPDEALAPVPPAAPLSLTLPAAHVGAGTAPVGAGAGAAPATPVGAGAEAAPAAPVGADAGAAGCPNSGFSCAVCGSSNAAVCARCRLVGYCGAEHQRKDWPAHKSVCRPGVFAVTAAPTCAERAATAAARASAATAAVAAATASALAAEAASPAPARSAASALATAIIQ
jgi:hypothetical protein